ncbi:RBPJL protein, partial [Polyodon spathula]|nr:RBPJL protein [Polyodon spathula]
MEHGMYVTSQQSTELQEEQSDGKDIEAPSGRTEDYPPVLPLSVLSLTWVKWITRTVASDAQLTPCWSISVQPVLTRDSLRQYLQVRPDQTVLILHAKVAQKSYGSEERFFCPPPCVYLNGPGWKLKQEELKANGLGDSAYKLCGYMGLDNAGSSQQPRFGCAKTLYLSDTDKRKHFRLVLKLFFSNGQEIGNFYSKLIKVISKPSQRKQSMKNADYANTALVCLVSVCISSGSNVSLFNRLRSQTVSTRYLSVEGGAFVASARQWAAFTMYLAMDKSSNIVTGDTLFYTPAELLHVSPDNGDVVSPQVICKVNKQYASLDVDEPVSQLQKCAFQFKDSNRMYLCLSNEKIIQFQASAYPKEPSKELFSDGSYFLAWLFAAVDFAVRARLFNRWPLFPMLKLGGGDVAMLEVQGENFSPILKIWFGAVEDHVQARIPKSLICVVPDISVFSGVWRWLRHSVTVPVSLIRSDVLTYSSAFSLTYTPEQSALPRQRVTPDLPSDSETLLESIHQEFTHTSFHLLMQS